MLGLGGATAFWDIATFGLVRRALAACGDRGVLVEVRGVDQGRAVPRRPEHRRGRARQRPEFAAEAGIDVYGQPHNETSTGVAMPVERVAGADHGALLLVDATSGAGGLPVDIAECDTYYFAPQKCFASDGGLWVALMSPAALERVAEIAASTAGSRRSSTCRRPSTTAGWTRPTTPRPWRRSSCSPSRSRGCSTQGGLKWCVSRTTESSAKLYGWAERSAHAHAVRRPIRQLRSLVVGTIDFDASVDAAALAAALRANGILDTEPYRKLGRNQLRVGMFPAVEPSDVDALTACIDYVIERL